MSVVAILFRSLCLYAYPESCAAPYVGQTWLESASVGQRKSYALAGGQQMLTGMTFCCSINCKVP